MKLHYDGSIRRLSGAGMAFAQLNNDIDPNVVGIGVKGTIAVPDGYVTIHRVGDDDMDFSFFFFDKETPYHISRGENIEVRNEGNAFGFELRFYLVD